MEEGVEVLRQINWRTYNQTVLHPLALLLLIIMAFVLLKTNSRYFFIPLLIIGAFLTHLQRIVVGSLDFSMIRLILIVGLLRGILRDDFHPFEKEKIDKLVIMYMVVMSIAYVALRGTTSALINRLGVSFETLMAFFIVRAYFNRPEQMLVFIKSLSFIFLLIALFMTIEQLTHHNLFAIFGGVPEITPIREGRLRAQGAFSHPILAGSFGAAFMPLFWGLRAFGKTEERVLGNIGIISSILIVWASSSSGPVLAMMGGVFAIVLWYIKHLVKYIKYGVLVLLICLHIVMDAPVWHLISRIDIVGGSTGWHRYFLIDQTINHFKDWFLFGVRTTGNWGWGLNDVTNMFIAQGVTGGFFSMVLFILIIQSAFRMVSISLEKLNGSIEEQKLFWSWGAVLFTHCVSFFGVSYFGQMNFFWILTLSMMACLPSVAKGFVELRTENNVLYNPSH